MEKTKDRKTKETHFLNIIFILRDRITDIDFGIERVKRQGLQQWSLYQYPFMIRFQKIFLNHIRRHREKGNTKEKETYKDTRTIIGDTDSDRKL